MQREDATRVAGYRAWQSMGRQVRKGEKGIRILAPISRKIEDEKTGEEVRTLCGFKTSTVFDISQTDGEELPEQPTAEDLDPAENAEVAETVCEGLRGFCEAEGVAVELVQRRPDDYGTYYRKERRIALNSELPIVEKATTLAHELAHHLLHGISQEKERPSKAAREIEAEGVAFVTCAAFGLDTSRFTFAYVANYAGETEALKAVLDRIQKAAQRLIGAVEELENAENPGEEGA